VGLKFGDDFIHSPLFFFFLLRRNIFKELLVCSIEWHLKMAAVDESERSAAFVLTVRTFDEKCYIVRMFSEIVLNPYPANVENLVSP
jgi:hypothetical protein